jgi:hypothetical protein
MSTNGAQGAQNQTLATVYANLNDRQKAILNQIKGFRTDDNALGCDYDSLPSILEMPDGSILKFKDKEKFPQTFIEPATANSGSKNHVVEGIHIDTSWSSNKNKCYVWIRTAEQWKQKYPNGPQQGGGGGSGWGGNKKGQGQSWQVDKTATVIQTIPLTDKDLLDKGEKIITSPGIDGLLSSGFQPHGPNGNDSTISILDKEANVIYLIREYVKKKPPKTEAPATAASAEASKQN